MNNQADKLGLLYDGKSFYERWTEGQNIPIIRGFYVPDLREVELAPWPWKGGDGAILDLEGTEETTGSYVCQIKPGGSLHPMRHVYEEFVFILSGRGATTIWQEGGPKRSFEWQKGSLFSLSLNAWYQHFNGSGTEPARYLAVTSAPLIMNLYRDLNFVFNCSNVFLERFDGSADHFNGEGTLYPGRIWDTNFIANVNDLQLHDWNERGKGSRNVMLEIGGTSMGAHISLIPPGRYKKAHRHGPGAHVIIIQGEGYSMMWPEGTDPQKFDWQEGSVIVPPDRWFHQHFNLGSGSAKYLALRWNSRKYRVFKQYKVDQNVKSGGDQIEYEDQDPMIHDLYLSELAKRGLEPQMKEVLGGKS